MPSPQPTLGKTLIGALYLQVDGFHLVYEPYIAGSLG